MSKVITKKELDLVIESTLEEAGLVSEESLCEGCKGAGCKDCEDRDEFDGRAGEVIGVDSDIDKQRMGEEDSHVEEGNEFTGALAKAKEEGKDEFEVDGKTYKVEESTEDDNDKLLKEELKKFNKIINY